mgnify:CR=1 FL=1
MSKDAYYFSHDSNARNDQRIIKLRRKYGAEGVGIYWMIIEILREQEDYTLGLDDDTIENIAYDLRVEQEKLEDIILHFDLFKRDKGEEDYCYIYSRSLKRRMERADLIRQKRSYAGQMSGKSRAVDKQNRDTSSTDDKHKLNIKGKEKKVKESKEKENNIQSLYVFEEFWNKYDLKLLRLDCEAIWSGEKANKRKLKFNDDIRKAVMEHLDVYIKHTSKNGGYPRRKYPKTYLNNNCWEDEVVILETVKEDYL